MGSDENSGERSLKGGNWVVQERNVTKVGAKLPPEPSIQPTDELAGSGGK